MKGKQKEDEVNVKTSGASSVRATSTSDFGLTNNGGEEDERKANDRHNNVYASSASQRYSLRSSAVSLLIKTSHPHRQSERNPLSPQLKANNNNNNNNNNLKVHRPPLESSESHAGGAALKVCQRGEAPGPGLESPIAAQSPRRRTGPVGARGAGTRPSLIAFHPYTLYNAEICLYTCFGKSANIQPTQHLTGVTRLLLHELIFEVGVDKTTPKCCITSCQRDNHKE
ncbi:hypothetical protein EYF80_016305 [Liparis tanakae]|uniref:Uncharacterized protein n=1 Tax=Liparis tanakae TaxID=230148 RepID=A0A4Z2I7S2_9TELE|nr:hypothetical protein EYF80_016305 [Liparis tanakae]